VVVVLLVVLVEVEVVEAVVEAVVDGRVSARAPDRAGAELVGRSADASRVVAASAIAPTTSATQRVAMRNTLRFIGRPRDGSAAV
jgi:hypothetical protein